MVSQSSPPCYRFALTCLTWLCFGLAQAWANPLGAQPTLVLPIHFDEPYERLDVCTMVNEADRLLQWNSSGLTWLEPVYACSYHPHYEACAYRTGAGLTQLRREALDALPPGIHLQRYRRLVIVLPSEFEGQGSVGTLGYELVCSRHPDFYASTAWVRADDTPARCGLVLLHELGHNLGFCHCEGAMGAHTEGVSFSPAARRSAGWPERPTAGVLVRR